MSHELALALKTHAIEALAFDLVGVAPAARLEGAMHLRTWVAAGCHGEMHFMADTCEVRGDPARFLVGARSVLCVAMSYHDDSEEPELTAGGERVVIARYARRADYHKVIKRRLVRLGRLLRSLAPSARWRVGVDEHPLLERELAQRAGLGWIGKNTCLINRRLGSELLLGELVTDVELPPGAPETDHCGRCTACLEACPTRAFAGPWRLDARRCISYLSIEHRSPLPAELEPEMGAHLFGCDICQSVCPWNRRAPQHTSEALRPRPHLADLRLPALQELDSATWAELAAGSPLRRLSYARFVRNLGVVATNLASQGDHQVDR